MYDNFFSIQINRQIDHHHIFLNDCFSVYNIRDSSYSIIYLRYIYYQFFSSFFIIFIKELEEGQRLKIIYLEKRHQMIQIFPIAKYISQIVKNYKELGNGFFLMLCDQPILVRGTIKIFLILIIPIYRLFTIDKRRVNLKVQCSVVVSQVLFERSCLHQTQ